VCSTRLATTEGAEYAPLLSTMIPTYNNDRAWIAATPPPVFEGGRLARGCRGGDRRVAIGVITGVAAQTLLAYGVIFYAMPAASIGLLAVAGRVGPSAGVIDHRYRYAAKEFGTAIQSSIAPSLCSSSCMRRSSSVFRSTPR
jgi:hypothetical protein